ncbi:hypothetical protein F4680DRAFT_321645 [Xylaria scruposa]|nr:hypothetical protein F4680DRAFT_321645 [Xylaria scruposa]
MPEMPSNSLPLLNNASFEDDEAMQLEKKEHESSSVFSSRSKNSKVITVSRVYLVAVHLFLFYLIFWVWNEPKSTSRETLLKSESWSPAREYIEYEINSEHATDHTKHSKYSGTPTRDQDLAWDDLIRPMFFNASIEELRRGGEVIKNLAVVEGGGYAATIGAYHELHCLRQLRFYLFQGRYYPNLTEAQENYLHGHLDHCIETLRLTIMCYGNPSLVSFAWGGDDATKPITQSNSRSVCVKWTSIDAWARSRAPKNYALAEEQPGYTN